MFRRWAALRSVGTRGRLFCIRAAPCHQAVCMEREGYSLHVRDPRGPAWQNSRAARPKPCGVYGANEGDPGSWVPDLSVTWDYVEAVTLRRGRCHTRLAGLARGRLLSCILRRQRNQSGYMRLHMAGWTAVRALFDVGCMPARSSAIPNREALYLSYRCSARGRRGAYAMGRG